MIIFKDRVEWLTSLPKDLIIAEVGVFQGEFSCKIYEKCRPKKLYLIDCWESQKGDYEKDPTNSILANQQEQIYNNVCESFKDLAEIAVIRSYSDVACQCFSKNYFDVVYLDADHTFEAVVRDLRNWWPLVKPGGFLAGHDYVRGLPWIQVPEGLDVFMNEQNLNFHSMTSEEYPSWAIRKLRS